MTDKTIDQQIKEAKKNLSDLKDEAYKAFNNDHLTEISDAKSLIISLLEKQNRELKRKVKKYHQGYCNWLWEKEDKKRGLK